MGTAETFELLLYAVIGISGALSVMTFAWGVIIYVARLGTERRLYGIRIMQWGVALILAAVLLIGVLRMVESY